MKTTGICLIFILIKQFCYGQYLGGDGDGFDVKIVSHFLQGDGFSVFKGGTGDGYTNQQITTNLTGKKNLSYYGGNGDGFTIDLFTGNMDGGKSYAFYGGNSDGFDSQFRGAFLNGSGDCIGGLIVQIDNDPILNGIYDGGNALKSKGKIRSGSVVTFNSANSILLEPGFLAENNAVFYAFLKHCLTAPINY